ncbi:hypothetical protein [Pedomonas mirosovicensis]|uniref:hypothetical protein n=1 Tax=Pedomonas mirosovicensis TaxID=2908641 RepID=UPI002169AD6D|nr:hypothetical protein [Pedomonas mirosovicensis]MCH8685551.1 hypothetical protein [Pedomonas mirosovicensis]
MMAYQAGNGSPGRRERCWHMITELDLMRLVADHSRLERYCRALEAATSGAPGARQRTITPMLRDMVETALELCARHGQERLEAWFDAEAGEPVAGALLSAIRAAHGSALRQCRELIATLERRAQLQEEGSATSLAAALLRGTIQSCRQAMLLEKLAIAQLAGERLTPGARGLLDDSLVALCEDQAAPAGAYRA